MINDELDEVRAVLKEQSTLPSSLKMNLSFHGTYRRGIEISNLRRKGYTTALIEQHGKSTIVHLYKTHRRICHGYANQNQFDMIISQLSVRHRSMFIR